MKKLLLTTLLSIFISNANATENVNYAFDFNQITVSQFIDFYLKMDKHDNYYLSEAVSTLPEKFTIKTTFSKHQDAENFFHQLIASKHITVTKKNGLDYYDLNKNEINLPQNIELDAALPKALINSDFPKDSIQGEIKQRFLSVYLYTLSNIDSESVTPFLVNDNCHFLTNITRPDLVTIQCLTDDDLTKAKDFIDQLDKPLKTGQLKLGFYQVSLAKDDLKNYGGVVSFLSGQLTASISAPVTLLGTSALKLATPNFNLSSYFSNTKSSFNTLSEPYAFLTNGQPVSFASGAQVPVLLSTAQATPSTPLQTQIKYIDTGLTVSVTPTFIGENKVKLLLSFKVSNAVKNQVSGIDSPSIDSKSITSTYIVDRGTTLIVGGLAELTNSKSSTSFLNVIPLSSDKSTNYADILFTVSLN